jgi:L-alanine-DL-glutamate epimerase-like enolase superfamily enzyme
MGAAPAARPAWAPEPGSGESASGRARITAVEVLHLSKPLKERFWMSLTPIGGYKPTASRTIVRIHTSAGITGEGEGGGAAASIFRSGFADLLIGEDPFMVEHIWQKMFHATVTRQKAERGWATSSILAAMAPVDAALWDFVGKSAGLPLYKLFGGYANRVACYVTGGYYREGQGLPELVAECQGYVKQGYRAIKLKVGGAPVDEDVARVKAVRQAIGPQVNLMLDVNGGWDLRTAIEASHKMAPLGILWLEEPLHWYDDVSFLAQLKKDCPIPLASGEHEETRYGARRLLETGAIDFLQFDCHAHAGMSEWRRLAGMASARDVWMAPHHEPIIHGHLLASIPNGYILESFANPDRDPFWFELYKNPPQIRDSVLTLGDQPGLGVELDPAALAKYGSKVL